jgi:hypothetical protein
MLELLLLVYMMVKAGLSITGLCQDAADPLQEATITPRPHEIEHRKLRWRWTVIPTGFRWILGK